MAIFLKLSEFIVNIDCIQQIYFSPDPPTVSITCVSGCVITITNCQDALALMDAVDAFSIDHLTVSSVMDENSCFESTSIHISKP